MGVKRSIGFLAAIAAALFIFAVPKTMTANAEDIISADIEQVYANMPDIKVYLSSVDKSEINAENVTAYLDDKAMLCEGISVFSDTDDCVDYYVLLDISSSNSSEVFEDMKESVISFEKKLGENDKLTFITFGTDVSTLYTTGDSVSFESVISNLKNGDRSTSLYSALAYMAKLADSNSNDRYCRKECILLTDGYDEAVGKETMDETKAKLLKYNIPVYSICTAARQFTVQEKLGELSRLTGGNIKFLDSGASCIDLMDEVVSEISNSLVLSFKADSNIVDNSEHKLALKFSDKNISNEKTVFLSHHQEDNIKPEITRVSIDGTNRLKVYFSENVINAALPENYSIINSSDEAITAKSVSYEKASDEYVAVLTFEDAIITDDYSISCKNIYDNSMEKNAIANSIQQHIDGAAPPNAFVEFLKSWWWIFLVVLILALAVLFAFAFVRFIKKRAVVLVNNEAVLKENVVIEKNPVVKGKQYNVRIKEKLVPEKSHIFMKIILSSGEAKQIDLEIASGVVVGRSRACDLCIEEPHMSRQHFAIEKINDTYCITDLNSTFGTSVNGVRINSRRKLEKNDIISAGTVRFQVNWN